MATLNSATVALQLEKVRKNIPLWFAKDHSLYSMIKAKSDVEVVSSRALRVPVKLGLGGGISQQTLDGDDLGIGTSASYDFCSVTPLYYCKAFSLSKAAEYATNSDAKSVENVTKKLVTDATDAMICGLDNLLQTDGSATLGAVASISGNVITLVGSANMFSPGQIIQVFSALGGTNRGNATVAGISANAGTVTLVSAPSGTAAGDLLIVQNAPGTAASSLFGKLYTNSAATTGSYLGLSRVTYPQLRANHVAGGSSALTLAMPRMLINSIRRVLGADAGTDVVFCMNTDQSFAYEQLSTAVQRIDLQTGTRDSTTEMLAESAPVTMAGRKILEQIAAPPGRIDALNIKTWGRAEEKPIDLYEVHGQTIFPQVGTSGGVAAASLGYIVSGQAIYCDNPMANGYIDALTVTAGT